MIAPTTWLALFLLWVLFYWFYRDYRLEYFHRKLALLGDELSSLARAGRVPPDSPAFSLLAGAISGTIRSGHEYGLLSPLATMFFTLPDPFKDRLVTRYERQWNTACKQLDQETEAVLRSVRARMHQAIAQQIALSSFVLIGTPLVLLTAFAAVCLKGFVLREFDNYMQSDSTKRFVSGLDWSAWLRG